MSTKIKFLSGKKIFLQMNSKVKFHSFTNPIHPRIINIYSEYIHENRKESNY